MDTNVQAIKKSGLAPVNGLKMYYDIEGTGDPLVYIPPALSHGGAKAFPSLTRKHSLIKVDPQGYGRTADIPDRPMSLDQHAKDVVALLDHLEIAKADFFGESYGGAIAVLIALCHPDRVGRVATYGATFGPPQAAIDPAMLFFTQPPTPSSACFQFLKDSYGKVAPHPDYWPEFWGKVTSINWEGFSAEQLASVEAPILIALGDRDFVRLEHAVETKKLLPNAELAVIPDAGHFALFSEPERVLPVIEQFLEKPATRNPVATADMGYQPGKTR